MRILTPEQHALVLSALEDIAKPIAMRKTVHLAEALAVLQALPEVEVVEWQNIDKPEEIFLPEQFENIDPMWHFMYRPLYATKDKT